LRRALAETGDGTDYVKNVAGRGYFLAVPATGASAAPAPPAATAPRYSPLPRYLTPLIGRDVELAEIGDSLGRNRLATITGMGGIGKTRLAVALGEAVAASFPDGVRYVDLAPLADPGAMLSALAVALDVPLSAADAGIDTIASAIGRQYLLLIFDNCEHVAEDAAALIGALLTRVEHAAVLATSQEVLHVPGERVFRLGPLALPPEGAPDIDRFAAVALFLERVQGIDHRFALTEDNAAGVAELCRCLDGVPLVLEMAAARLPLLGVEGLLAGLDARLQMLKAGSRHAIGRHRTLAAMVDWSYSLLDAAEQEIFCRLSVFSGSFSLDAALAVAGGDYPDWEVVDILGRLLDKSFLGGGDGGSRRYRLLETLRLYAAEQLSASGSFDRLAERHARYFSALLHQAHDAFEVTPEIAWTNTYRPELGNVRAALRWCLADRARADLAIALAGNSGRLWQVLSLVVEGRRHVDAALLLIGEASPAAARLLLQAAALHRMDQAKSLALAQRSAEFFEACGDRIGLATVQSHTGAMLMFLGRLAEAEASLDLALAALAGSGRQKTLANVLMNLGNLATLRQDTAKARAAFGQALLLARTLQHANLEFDLLHNSAEMEFCAGFTERAIALMREFLPRIGESDNLYVPSNINMAAFLIAQGKLDEGAELVERVLIKAGEAGGYALRVALLQAALVLALGGTHDEAARLYFYVAAGFAAAGDLWQPIEDQARQRIVALIGSPLDGSELEAAGAQMSDAAAVALAASCLAARRAAL
jgi:predicted ATPase